MTKAITKSLQAFVKDDNVQKRIQETLAEDAREFTLSVLALANQSPKIAECEPMSVINACMVAASISLPINNNLGLAYVVPYDRTVVTYDDNGKKVFNKVKEAQFQMAAKGYIQLAQRSGKYARLAAEPVRALNLKSQNPLLGNSYDWSVIGDEAGEIIGYVGFFRTTSGFEKDLFMTTAEIDAHAAKYSKSYQYDIKSGKKVSNWSTNFDAMARKTVIKLLISKWGELDTNLTKAMTSDQAVIRDDGNEYVDNDDSIVEGELATDAEEAAILQAHDASQ